MTRLDPRLRTSPLPTVLPALLAHPGALAGLAVLSLALAVAAIVGGGQLLLTWDQPIQRAVESSRTPAVDDLFVAATFLGSTAVVLALGAVTAVVAWPRCRVASLAVALAVVTRPGFEAALKLVIGRQRPDLHPLLSVGGPSFPSGHVLAAISVWGMVPVVVALYTRRQAVWQTTAWACLAIIVAIAASRVYLGVHWFSDVVAGLAAGVLFLAGVAALFARAHARDGGRCAAHPACSEQPVSGAHRWEGRGAR